MIRCVSAQSDCSMRPRPKFYPASVLPVIVGTAFGVLEGDGLNGLVFALALLATVAVHAASNVLNDVGDDEIGTGPG